MKYSAQLFAILFIAFPIFSSCVLSTKTSSPIYGNHQLVNQRINIDDYEKVILNIPGEVFYQQFSDSTPYLQIHTDENILNLLDVKVQDNQLIISVKDDSIIKPSQLTIYTCSHNLAQVVVRGEGNIRLKGEVNAKDFKTEISGSGNFLADSLICERMNASITGSGNINLTGASSSSSFAIAGSGSIHAFNYLVQESDCSIAGSGNIETLVDKTLNASITGSGNISYRGNPEANKKIMGSGTIQAVN
jgi:hypothetical protein